MQLNAGGLLQMIIDKKDSLDSSNPIVGVNSCTVLERKHSFNPGLIFIHRSQPRLCRWKCHPGVFPNQVICHCFKQQDFPEAPPKHCKFSSCVAYLRSGPSWIRSGWEQMARKFLKIKVSLRFLFVSLKIIIFSNHQKKTNDPIRSLIATAPIGLPSDP